MKKTVKIKQTLIVLSALLSGSSIYAQHDHSSHQKQEMEHSSEHKIGPTFKNEQLTIAYNSYTQINEALAADNAIDAKKRSSQLYELLEGVQGAGVAQQEAKKLSATKSLKEQRDIFVTLSAEMTKVIKDNDISKGEIYITFCPMANNNEGAYWLSNDKEIHNPYLGLEMSKCGSVKEILNAD
ncbi:DUF3347 domain-containing protein [bacterium]|nr:DUF3347 domain-containing protein [bacterium]